MKPTVRVLLGIGALGDARVADADVTRTPEGLQVTNLEGEQLLIPVFSP